MRMMYDGRRGGPKCPMCGEPLRNGGHRLWGRTVVFCPACGFVDEEGVGHFE